MIGLLVAELSGVGGEETYHPPQTPSHSRRSALVSVSWDAAFSPLSCPLGRVLHFY